MEKVCYDIECLPNFFCVVFSGLDSDKVVKLRITEDQDDRESIIAICRKYILIGYNNHGYDDLLINMLIENPNTTNQNLYELSQAIIAKGRMRASFQQKDLVNRYKFKNYLSTIDMMTMLASSKLRVSLKHLQIVIKWHNVEEFECDWDFPLPKDRWDNCETYCVNDVLSLKAVCKTQKKGFELRDFVYKETGLEVHSLDPVKIAELTMCHAVAQNKGEHTKSFMYETVQENKPIDLVFVNDLLLPFINFKTPIFQKVHETYKNHVFSPAIEAKKSPKDKFKIKCLAKDGMMLNFGLGGLHHDFGKGLVHRKQLNHKLIQADVKK